MSAFFFLTDSYPKRDISTISSEVYSLPRQVSFGQPPPSLVGIHWGQECVLSHPQDEILQRVHGKDFVDFDIISVCFNFKNKSNFKKFDLLFSIIILKSSRMI